MTVLPSLAGVRVLDFSRLLPGPYGTQLLRQMGAAVIKLEPPLGGDPLRAAPEAFGLGAMFEPLNRGKQSVAVNHRNPAGRELVRRLAAESDVLVESFRPGVLERAGLGYADLHALNPRLIYCSLSGYGQAGPYRDRAGHDLNYLAVGGLLALCDTAGPLPAQPGVQIADLAGGMLAALLITGALVERDRTGCGRRLDVALLDAAVLWALPLAAAALGRQPPYNQAGPLGGDLPCYHVYATADGQAVTLGALEAAFWANFCGAVGRPDLLPRHLDPAAVPEVAALFRSRPRAEWQAVFENADACVEFVVPPAALRDQPQVQLRAAALTPPDLAPAPALGQHTAEVLSRIGVPAAELAALAEHGVIRLGA